MDIGKLKIGFRVLDGVLEPGHLAASTKIRARDVSKYLPRSIISESDEELMTCDVVVFQSRFWAKDRALAKLLVAQGKITILDVTDPYWLREYKKDDSPTPEFDEMCSIVDRVIVCSPMLGDMLTLHYPGIRWKVIGDRVDLEEHDKMRRHVNRAEQVILWHGDYGNLLSFETARSTIESLSKAFNLKIMCIYNKAKEHPIQPFTRAKLVVKEWGPTLVAEELLNTDISINPRFRDWRSYKTNNKTVKAWACGVPCTEYPNHGEMSRWLESATIRNLEGIRRRQEVEELYDVNISVCELRAVIKEIIDERNFYSDTWRPSSPNRAVVLTAIVGERDELDHDQEIEDADYVAFVDRYVESKTWKTHKINLQFCDPVREAKVYKCLPHQFVPGYDYCLWLDGTFALKVPIEYLIETYMQPDTDIAIFTHPERDCIYEEASFDLRLCKDTKDLIERQMENYRAEGYPEHGGLYACGIMLRRQTPKVAAFNNAWWSEICTYSTRDQWSFAYLARKMDIKLSFFQGGVYYRNNYFAYTPHKGDGKSTANEPTPEDIQIAKNKLIEIRHTARTNTRHD